MPNEKTAIFNLTTTFIFRTHVGINKRKTFWYEFRVRLPEETDRDRDRDSSLLHSAQTVSRPYPVS
jgi:hypothetical protein